MISLRRLVGQMGGTVVTSPTVLQAAQQKSELWQSLGKPKRAMVDMESYVLCCGLADTVSSLHCARVVSDAAEEGLPDILAGMGEESGGVPLRTIVAGVLREPHVVADLLRLRRRLVRGAEALGEWVEKQVGS